MDASGQKCYIRGATSNETADIYKLSKKVPKEDSFEFGLLILHAYIRFFECIIHIGYKLSVKEWRVSFIDYINQYKSLSKKKN